MGSRGDQADSLTVWADLHKISRETAEIYSQSEVIDLHIEPFLWKRLTRYDFLAEHTPGPFPGVFGRQTDLPRLREARITGATWVITTNPLRTAEGRAQTFVRNLARLRAELAKEPTEVAVVRNTREYREAREKGLHGAFIGIQGGNALDLAPDGSSLDLIEDDTVLRVTLVHLSTSRLGTTSSPLKLPGRDEGLTTRGKDFVKALDARKIFVDLAHISRKGFFDALEVHDRSLPVLVTHTGVTGVTPHWRNIDDAQLRAVADLGGTIGVMYQSSFLGDPNFAGRMSSVMRHLEHIISVVGEDFASLGSDWDGMIVTPRDMPTCTELPKLVDLMLTRGWSPERVQKVLGENFLRVVAALRG